MEKIKRFKKTLDIEVNPTFILKILIPSVILLMSIFLLTSWNTDPHTFSFGFVILKKSTATSFLLTAISMSLTQTKIRFFVVGATSATIYHLFHSYLNALPSSFPTTAIDSNFQAAVPDMPSLLTLFLFLIIQLGLLGIKPKRMGQAVVFFGASALFGYGLNMPWMYGYVAAKSTAMAVTTSAIMVLSGIWLILEAKTNLYTLQWMQLQLRYFVAYSKSIKLKALATFN